MAVVPQQQQPATNWKDAAIEKSQAITDAWEVTKIFAGRIAEWVLFGCMVMNIIEILPGVTLWPAVSNAVLGVQAITLDVAGFGLASMADHARINGDEKAARSAEITGWCLISLMVLTLLLVSIGLLWPFLKVYTDMAEKALILARVVMTVAYGHVVHGLRRSGHTAQVQPQPIIPPAPAIDYEELARTIAPLLPAAPAPQLDYSAIAREVAPMFEATIVREIKAIATIAGPPPAPQLEARASSQGQPQRPTIEATIEGQQKQKASQGQQPGPAEEASTKSQDQATDTRSATDARSAEEKLEAAYQQLLTAGVRISGRALAPLARVNKNRAAQWLRDTHPEVNNEGQGQQDSEPGPNDEEEATNQGQE